MYVIVWEFVVRPEKVREFVSAYRADGDWGKLFRLSEGYIGTELLAEEGNEVRFVTIDRWRAYGDFIRFQEAFGQQYKLLDAQLEGLTVAETKVGAFTPRA
jgi:hypothetical protein